ncbi:MAG: DUF2283 domain-containing protein [Dehalococcoidia bacterium]|nr:hypothetical protein [Chloroflexota bacterium]MBT9160214.1 hypothetical protein [Chloroflexota bacterium]MBT9161588.1 hypothetical protein [Chloroflexota bacterium]
MKTTNYFTTSVTVRRPYLKMKWIEYVLNSPICTEVQANGRIRHWALIVETGKYLRVVTEPDGKTIHNAFLIAVLSPKRGGGRKKMVFQYHPDTDMLYLKLVEGVSTESEEVTPGIVLDFDEHNRVIGIEIEDASNFVDLSRLEVLALPVANLILSERVSAKV